MSETPSTPAADSDTGQASEKPPLKIYLAGPRGFCAGVERAIDIVDLALQKYGAPVYVRHEIVHNRYVVEQLEAKGAVFVEDLNEAPADKPIIFSAHGVPKVVPAEADRREMFYIDATCPLVSKVHREAERQHKNGNTVILIGHDGHPEVEGTIGQLPEGAIKLVQDPEEVWQLEVEDPERLAFVTQTTLSLDDTMDVINALRERFPTISAPKQEDICYATTNRQHAVKALADKVETMVVVGAPNSSNSMRLVEVAKKQGCDSFMVQRAEQMDWSRLNGVRTIGVTAGASAPELLVDEVIAACREHFDVSVEEVRVTQEDVQFKLPRALADAAA
ncbi:4-hydroxy-3-methylbut-2-enyl diphosphate reductase [Limimonas halophila]|uniref:4-hydroxy-3-methylbut-2-enyl diphosphate reductase n=1 Tax=Limimonas halophila TaxID=1082479 RepID=A0A1G7PS18_9PROT|nr:4-hydroxy-3-methylbut-2-enyl diphosphate reductase [Limimonas halophila]SDF89152.1 4-hydroxy-3-methylbut-2-enyl diphosphate reductase [Limimonas halophila]